MEFSEIEYVVRDGVATITLSRPDRLNAFTSTMNRELLEALDAADDDDGVRVIIFTGSGRGYCAGADLGSGGGTFDYGARSENIETMRDGGGRLTLRIFDSKKFVIGAINGPAVGIGATMTLPMDVRIASESARFGFVFSRRGVVPEAASSWFLPRVVGISTAMEWVGTGRVFNSKEALAGGLVRSVVPDSELMVTASALAAEIVDNTSAVSVALARRMMWTMLGASHPMQAHRVDSKAMFERGRSTDAYEGVASFLEKRKATFQDRVSDGLPDVFPSWTNPDF